MTELGRKNRLLNPNRKQCPVCHDAPELIVKNDRHVPVYCERCEGRGTVPKDGA